MIGGRSLAPGQFAPAGAPVELTVGGRPALRGSVGQGSISLQLPHDRELRQFRVSAGQFADLEAPGVVPRFDLVLEDAEGTTRVPIATWTRIEMPMPHAEPPLPKLLAPPHRDGD